VGRDRWSAIGLALLAIGYLLAARRYPLDTLATPGPGIVPLGAGLALLALSIWLLVTGRPRPVADPALRWPAIVVSAVLVLYAAVLPRLGFVVSSFALVVVSSRLMGLRGWWRPAALALGVAAAAYLLFARWLGVPLP
jgi:putative tricarboxylic transport membrane protein